MSTNRQQKRAVSRSSPMLANSLSWLFSRYSTQTLYFSPTLLARTTLGIFSTPDGEKCKSIILISFRQPSLKTGSTQLIGYSSLNALGAATYSYAYARLLVSAYPIGSIDAPYGSFSLPQRGFVVPPLRTLL
jgi:hypothetical protein